ncbi:MAG: hypothetical protein D6796_09900 [Caldilineae bacterium]|nr:MAG: hypothetical protein D6796_09900 [Caldilineae bacterium]
MKRFRVILLAAVLALIFGFGYRQIASAYRFSYNVGYQVQNLSASTTDITIAFYDQTGTKVTEVSDSLPGNGSKTYFPIAAVSDGFTGSVVISANRNVAAIVNVIGDNFNAGASYIASQQGATRVLLPLLMYANNGFSTWFNVQNTGSAPANVNVVYSDGITRTATIPPRAAFTFDQTTEGHQAGAVFGAIITSDQPVVAAAVEEDAETMFAYSGFVSGSTAPIMPLINANNNGYETGVQIQNIGNQDTTVTVTYTPSMGPSGTLGFPCTETQTIPAGGSRTFALYAFAGAPFPGMTTNCLGKQLFVGSARVTTNSTSQPLTIIVNQLLFGINGEAYSAFDPAVATAKVVLPLVMDRNNDFFTGFNIMNVGTSRSTISCQFTGTTFGFSVDLDAGEASTQLQFGKIDTGYVGSATCTADGNGKILAIVNELNSTSTDDQFLVYEGINQ